MVIPNRLYWMEIRSPWPPLWQASTAYSLRPARDAALGSLVRPAAFNDRQFRCVQAGTSGTSEPVWNLTLGGQTADGGALCNPDIHRNITKPGIWISGQAHQDMAVVAEESPRSLGRCLPRFALGFPGD